MSPFAESAEIVEAVTRNGDNLTLNMPGNVTFKTASADLNAGFFKVLDSVAVVLKEVAAKQVQDSNDNILTFVVAAILTSSVAPDLRPWRTLPGEHQVAQVPVPSDGRVRIELLARRGGARGGGRSLELAVPTSGPSLVWVRSTRATNLVAHAAPLVRPALAVPPEGAPQPPAEDAAADPLPPDSPEP